MTSDVLCQLRDVDKRYGSTYAVRGVSLELRAGEVHALLGENGAGKSTIAKILSGATAHDGGTVIFDRQERKYKNPAEAARAGLSMVYQETSLIDTMTVAQNLMLGEEKMFNRLSEVNIIARELLESHNFHIRPEVTVGSLGAAQKQMVEIARAVHRNAKLIIFDEPTASVTPEEKQQLFLSIQRLAAQGVALLFITHNIEEALSEADRISVMRDGVLDRSGHVSEFTRESIVTAMVGRSVEYSRRVPARSPDPTPVLEVDDITLMPIVRNMSFSAFAGEIVGLAGLVGAGRTEVTQIIAGITRRRRIGGGEIRLNGKPVRFRTPRHARAAGISYISEDRKASGIFSHLTIADNLHLAHLSGKKPLPIMALPSDRNKLTAELIERYAVRTLNPTTAKLVELSGGNQQKVMLAKGLSHRPDVAIIDEPTRGVDVGAIEEIHDTIRALADDGVAVIIISSYLPEILALSDRVLVARAGHVVAEFDAATTDQEAIMFAAVH